MLVCLLLGGSWLRREGIRVEGNEERVGGAVLRFCIARVTIAENCTHE